MRTPLWLLPNVLSLDAPVIALLWQHFFSASFGVPITFGARASLGFAVWAVYIADRLLDTRRLSPTTARHAFHHRHRPRMLILLILALTGGAVFAFSQVRPSVILPGIGLGVAVMLYLAAVYRGYLRATKEVAVAGLFTAGAILAPVVRTPEKTQVVVAGFALFLACLLNLLSIDANESGRAPQVRFGIVALVLLASAVAWGGGDLKPIAAASALSVVCLLALDLRREAFSKNLFRVLADAALLSPLPIRLLWPT